MITRNVVGRVGLFLVGYLVVLRVASVPKGMVPPALADVTWGTLATLGIVALTRVMTRPHASRAPVRLTSAGARQLLGGAALGFVVYALVLAAIALTVAPLRVTLTAAPTIAASALTVIGFLALACMEELGFRGYPLRTLVEASDARLAVLVVSVLFAASHVLFGWPWQAILLGVLPSGVLFGVAAVVSGGLAMPIGLHASLNVAQWIAGEKATPGFFTLALDPQRVAQGARLAPYVGATIPILVAAALWRCYPRVARTD